MPVLEKHRGLIAHKDEIISVNSRIIDSSNVEAVAWPTGNRSGVPLMIVRYKGGGLYGYIGVSRQRAVAAAYAPSTGRYINQRIKEHFETVKLR